MTLFRIIRRSFRHYLAGNLATAAGMAITTAVICGALIIGDSLQHSLLGVVDQRLGQTTHVVSAGERIFTMGLAERLDAATQGNAAAVLKTEASMVTEESGLQLNKVQVWGVDDRFERLYPEEDFVLPGPGKALISENLATRLGLQAGDHMLVRFRKVGHIPPNTPFVAEGQQGISRRLRIAGILDGAAGRLNLQASQTAPYNLFVDIGWLNRVMDLREVANLVLMGAGGQQGTEEVRALVQEAE